MIRSPFFVLLLGMLSLFLLAGCGGGSGSDAPPQPPVVFYAITSDVNPEDGGTVLGTGNYRSGTSFTLTAVPAPGYVFDRWVENGSELTATGSAELFGTANANRHITAEFLPLILELSSDDLTLNIGDQAALSARLVAGDLEIDDVSSVVSWISSNDGVAAVDDQGHVTAISEGTALISAEYGGQLASASVLVLPDSLESLRFEPSTVTLLVGSAPYLPTLIATYESGAEIALPSDRAQWSSSSAVASVSPDGVVAAVEIGTAEITAAVGDEQDTLTVTVTGAPLESLQITTVSPTLGPDRRVELFVGDQVQFRALGSYPGVGEVDLTDRVTWLSDSDALTIVNGGANAGLASAVREAEEVSVSARVDELGADAPVTATITIDPERPAAITVTSQLPGDIIRLVEGESSPPITFDAVVRNGLGGTVSEQVNLIFTVVSGPLTFTDGSVEEVLATVSGEASITGTITGPGQALVRVRVEGASLTTQRRVFVINGIDEVLLASRSISTVSTSGGDRLRVRFNLINLSGVDVPVVSLKVTAPVIRPDGSVVPGTVDLFPNTGPDGLPFDAVPANRIVGDGLLFSVGTDREEITATYRVEDPATGERFDINL